MSSRRYDRPALPSRDLYSQPPPPPSRDDARVSRRALFGLRMRGGAAAEIDHATATARVLADVEAGAPWPLLAQLTPVAEVIAEAVEVRTGERVLDVGAGDGNVAMACVARGAAVEACDLAQVMVARGRARCGDVVNWRCADVAELPYEDSAFDVAVSAFGVAQSPRPLAAVGELARVCRPGGRIALAAWIPRGLPGGLIEHLEAFRPLPDGVLSPANWGRQDVAGSRLAGILEEIELRTRTVRLSAPTPDDLFAAVAPPTLDADRRAVLRIAFDGLLAAAGHHPDAEATVDARYLVMSGRRVGG